MPTSDFNDVMATAEKGPAEKGPAEGTLSASFSMHATDLVVLFAAPELEYVASPNPTPRAEIELFNDSGDIVAQARIPLQESGTLP
jgi:hypothetical protein